MLRRSCAILFTVFFASIAQANTPPALSNPDVTPEAALGPEYLGNFAGKATVSAGGNAAYTLPLTLPPGTAGMTPPLSLHYNSNMENGLLGLGWFLGGAISKISRCPQTMSQDGESHAVDWSSDDRFCLDGHRLIAVSGTYGAHGTEYRTENDSFSRITSYGSNNGGPTYFIVETPDGMTKEYGNSSQSRILLGGIPTIQWMMNRVEDSSGNYYDISYHIDLSYHVDQYYQYYPSEIEYTGNSAMGLSPNASIKFIWEDRPDPRVIYRKGVKVIHHPKRLASIEKHLNSAMVGEYNFTYETVGVSSASSTVGNVSRLTSIEHCDNASNCQKPIQLTWRDTANGIGTSFYDLTVPADTSNYSQEYATPRWHDLNGDGTPDYIVPDQSGGWYTGDFDVLLSGPSGYTSATWSSTFTGNLSDKVHWADIDGDGRTDALIEEISGTTHSYKIAFSTGAGFSMQTWSGYTEDSQFDVFDFFLYDMDGDKLLDLVVKETDSILNYGWYCGTQYGYYATFQYRISVHLNTGTDFGTKTVWAYPVAGNADLADMNSDGYMDLVEQTRYVHYNNGSSFDSPQDYSSYGAPNCVNPGTYNAFFHDYNGDGLADRLSGSDVEINTGYEFIVDDDPRTTPVAELNGDGKRDGYDRTVYDDPGAAPWDWNEARVYLRLQKEGYWYTRDTQIIKSKLGFNRFHGVADVDGDGIYEYTIGKTQECGYVRNPPQVPLDIKWCDKTKIRIYDVEGGHLNLLEKITTGLGHETTFTYKPLTDHSIYTKGTGAALPEIDVQDSTHVVTSFSQSDGIGGTIDVDYAYEGLVRDTDGYGNLGFAKITAVNTDTGLTTISEYYQEYPKGMKPKLVEIFRSSDNRRISKTETNLATYGTVGSGPVFAYINWRTEEAFDLGDGRKLSTKTTTTNTIDAYGNISDSEVQVVDHENSTTHKTQTLSTFNIDTVNWRVNQLVSRTQKFWLGASYSSTKDRTTDFTYYSSTGLLKDTIQEPSKGAGVELTKTLAYDGYGNVTSETISGPSLASRTSTISYDGRGQFPVTMTNPISHQITRTWEPKFGTKLSETDANGLTTTWTYTSFGLPLFETRPDGTTTESKAYEDNSSANGHAEYYVEIQSSGTAPVRRFSDIRGREIRVRSQGFDGSYVHQDTEYDVQGRVYRKSEPYFTGDTVYWNINTYDLLGRLTFFSAADPTKVLSNSYDGFEVTTLDALARSSSQTFNAVGQVIKAVDKAGTEMTFTYDTAGNRIQVTNAMGLTEQNSVTYEYDRLGRMTKQIDPDHGEYNYKYDALGQTTEEVSPKMAAAGQKREFDYDLIGRLIEREEPEGIANWVYDNTSGGNLGVGRLYSESQFGFSKTYAYAAGNYGRLTGTSTTIDSTAYNTALEYDANGRVVRETYPASHTHPTGWVVEYQYNATGALERVQNWGGSDVYYQLLDSDASGRMTQQWLGDGSTLTQGYQGQSSRINSQVTVNGGTTVQSFSYGYDNAGNMTSRADAVHSISEAFTFDNLDRLTSAQVAGQTAVTYGFDVTGNITQKSDRGNPFQYTTNAVHAVTSITTGGGTDTLSYDANGNYSSGTNMPNVTWSTYNKPTQIQKGGITYNFEYGPDRRRYKKTSGLKTTYYVGGSFEKLIDGANTEYRSTVRANGVAVMIRQTFSPSSSSSRFIHRDHLGSVTALTQKSSGSVVERYSYDAWGQRRSATDWFSAGSATLISRGYTGHEHLDDVGVLHMNGRIYDPALGRMLSPDPVTQAPENGQNYNRYTYTYNNPLKYTDPSGYCNVGVGLSIGQSFNVSISALSLGSCMESPVMIFDPLALFEYLARTAAQASDELIEDMIDFAEEVNNSSGFADGDGDPNGEDLVSNPITVGNFVFTEEDARMTLLWYFSQNSDGVNGVKLEDVKEYLDATASLSGEQMDFALGLAITLSDTWETIELATSLRRLGRAAFKLVLLRAVSEISIQRELRENLDEKWADLMIPGVRREIALFAATAYMRAGDVAKKFTFRKDEDF